MNKLSLVRRALPVSVTQKAGRLALRVRSNSPHILFAAGVVGFGTTVVLSSRATLKLEPIVEELHAKLSDISDIEANADLVAKHNYTSDVANRDRIVLYSMAFIDVTKLYGPTIVAGSLTLAAFTRAHMIQNARIASVTAAYVGLDRAFRRYREVVQEAIGEEAEAKLNFHAKTNSTDILDEDGEKKIVKHRDDPSQFARFFDEYSESWTRRADYNLVFLRAQQQYHNELLRSRGYVFLNDVYRALGMEPNKIGQTFGWVLGPDNNNFVDFGFLNEKSESARRFVNGLSPSVLLDFNVDGYILDRVSAPGWKEIS